MRSQSCASSLTSAIVDVAVDVFHSFSISATAGEDTRTTGASSTRS
jgi:hypothetical protein